MQARKGRASYLGERSIGHQDPGATSVMFMIQSWLPQPKSKDNAMVNLVIVSHSARLGEGVGELARQMLTGDGCKLAIAAGIDDPENPIGTDPIKVMEAIESVADTDHVLVMMDIGSALLSGNRAGSPRSGDRGEGSPVRRAAGRRHAGGNGQRRHRIEYR
jgi:hypothetical protein